MVIGLGAAAAAGAWRRGLADGAGLAVADLADRRMAPS